MAENAGHVFLSERSPRLLLGESLLSLAAAAFVYGIATGVIDDPKSADLVALVRRGPEGVLWLGISPWIVFSLVRGARGILEHQRRTRRRERPARDGWPEDYGDSSAISARRASVLSLIGWPLGVLVELLAARVLVGVAGASYWIAGRLVEALAFGVLGFIGWRLWKRARFPGATVSLAKAPGRPGERVTLSFHGPTAVRAEALDFELRYLVEKDDFKLHGGHLSYVPVVEVLESLQPVDKRILERVVEVTFDLPTVAPPNRTHERPARFWELGVTSREQRYGDQFLVPVLRQDAVALEHRAADGASVSASPVSLDLVHSYMNEARWKDAQTAIEALIAETPDDVELCELHAEILSKTSPREAWRPLERAHALAPEDAPLLRRLVELLEIGGEHAKAAELRGKALALAPDSPDDALARARALVRAGRFADAASAFDRFFELVPERTKAYLIVDESIAARLRAGLELSPLQTARLRSRRRSNLVALAIVAAIALSPVALLVWTSDRVQVVVDNPTENAFALSLDGEHWISVPARSFRITSAHRGSHRIDLSTVGKSEGFDVTWDPGRLAAFSGGTFVCDPLGCGHYAVEEVAYGDAVAAPPSVHEGERSFYAGPHVHCVFVAPPEKVETKNGGAIRRVLRRLPP